MADVLTDKPADLYQIMIDRGFGNAFVLGMATPHLAALKQDRSSDPNDIIALERLVSSL